MIRIVVIFAFFSMVLSGAARSQEIPPDTFFDLRNTLAERGFGYEDIQSPSYFLTCDAEEAFQFILLANRTGGVVHPNSRDLVGRAAGANQEFEDFLTAKIRTLPVWVENGGERFSYWQVLSKVPAQWALDLAIESVTNPVPMSRRDGKDMDAPLLHSPTGYYDNAELAVWVIGSMGIEGYPGGSDFKTYGKKLQAECRSWIQAHPSVKLPLQKTIDKEADPAKDSNQQRPVDSNSAKKDEGGRSFIAFVIGIVFLLFIIVLYRFYLKKQG